MTNYITIGCSEYPNTMFYWHYIIGHERNLIKVIYATIMRELMFERITPKQAEAMRKEACKKLGIND